MVNESVHRESAIERLPDAYAVALRMRDAGLSYAAIAERVGVEPEAVGPMLRVAKAKLASTGYDDTSES
ncbi:MULTISPECIES: sigma factor-like helix-turn-helix DNA-binding protein [Rhodococcus]|jgi:DNA-directed RNA polymerase specialized sigma24 family protein|uniref:sigma factor-like helix-turn-helix DNA-binding protein n=1 Tax=Rhodococcus TaxID=1827 RepID=UPI0023E3357D|nr:sigma factor-like helix-turn-helix DNA-binding protein [Rhodococcus sp. T2V]MDF3311613.1 sigma factor-like helix-turn-helix DNA-binding protein [Rhodococcus sp. T2V]